MCYAIIMEASSRLASALMAVLVFAASPRPAGAQEDAAVKGLSSTGFALMALQTASLIGATTAYSTYSYTSHPTTGHGTQDTMEKLFLSTLSIGYASYAIGIPLLLGSYHRSRIVNGLTPGDALSITGWVFYGLSCVFIGVMPLFTPLAIIAGIFYATTLCIGISAGALAIRDAKEQAAVSSTVVPFALRSQGATMVEIGGRF